MRLITTLVTTSLFLACGGLPFVSGVENDDEPFQADGGPFTITFPHTHDDGSFVDDSTAADGLVSGDAGWVAVDAEPKDASAGVDMDAHAHSPDASISLDASGSYMMTCGEDGDTTCYGNFPICSYGNGYCIARCGIATDSGSLYCPPPTTTCSIGGICEK